MYLTTEERTSVLLQTIEDAESLIDNIDTEDGADPLTLLRGIFLAAARHPAWHKGRKRAPLPGELRAASGDASAASITQEVSPVAVPAHQEPAPTVETYPDTDIPF